MMSSGSTSAQYVGPYKLDKTLGKGQTGLVKMGIHCVTGKKVAIKVINRVKLSENIINKVEREISIMKLIDHPHILRLFDVYENKKYLYLILELVSGGELFDYLVRKGRLPPREARRFFRQIVSAVDFCHQHNVCHRDLKPENLLLDEKNNIKVADFGMASLQPEGFLLETSCGSPHYACPEVIRGDKYDGRTADVWSCGVVLFALLVGTLPFDDDNLRHLLEKVKRGIFYIPHYVPSDAQNLLRGMIEVRTEKRLTLKAVLKHKWMCAGDSNGFDNAHAFPTAPFDCHPISCEEDADPDVLLSMSSLGCFRERDKLLANLMSKGKNTEKVVYHMLLRRKKRHPSYDDEADALPCKHPDAPRKRVDSTSSRSSLSSSIDDVSVDERAMSNSSLSSVGCRGSRRKLSAEALNSGDRPSSMTRRGSNTAHQRSRSLTGESNSRMHSSGSNTSNKISYSSSHKNGSRSNSPSSQSPSSSPLARGNSQSSTASLTGGKPWRQRLANIKNSFLGSPRFHRRKIQVPSTEDVNQPPSHTSPSMELTKRSWFGQFVSGSSSSMSGRDDVPLTLVMNERSLNSVKTDLAQTFLSISNLTYTMIDQTRFVCEYRSRDRSQTVFNNKLVSFQADIIRASGSESNDGDQSRKSSYGNYHVTFNLIFGPNRRFKRVLELIQIQLQAHPYVPQNEPEGDISAYSRELQQYCTSSVNQHNDTSSHTVVRK